ncbi:endonuclease 2 [Tupanvirus soda lake]|uniref:Endonuclease 2 n=2 Tax=Tupanvirus TaxID=2094720 RepID=A0A6N1NSR5_9VIRU|nr:endonuclease 2 [Tupanvirus soda lake]QKU34756.1 endonuclease 2 [Tupanvirus soda lake]
MGVSVTVNNALANSEDIIPSVSFNDTLSKVGYDVIDFRNWGMKWYFYDTKNKYHHQYLRENNVSPENLILGAKAIINDVADELEMSLPSDPIEARKILEGFFVDNKEELHCVIKMLQKMYDDNEINKAWNFITELASKNKDEIENNLLYEKIKLQMDYVELAVFFYTAGKNGHSIEWGY